MRNLLVIFFISQFTYCQIKILETPKVYEVGKFSVMGTTYIYLTKSDNTFCFHYKDYVYPNINEYKKFCLLDEDSAIENLYNIIINGIREQPADDITIELPNDILKIRFGKMMGTKYAKIYHYINKNPEYIAHTTELTEKGVKKLFSKK